MFRQSDPLFQRMSRAPSHTLELLSHIRVGKLDSKSSEELMKRYMIDIHVDSLWLPTLAANENRHEYQSCCRTSASVSIDDGILPTKLYATSSEVDWDNEQQLDLLQGERIMFHSEDRKYDTKLDYLKNINVADTVPLKIGAQVMLLRNISVGESRKTMYSMTSFKIENLLMEVEEW